MPTIYSFGAPKYSKLLHSRAKLAHSYVGKISIISNNN